MRRPCSRATAAHGLLRRGGRWDVSRRGWRGGAAYGEGKAGNYCYTAVTDAWEWSGAVYQIHGFTPGGVVPGAELMLAHAHAADRHNIERALQACLRDGKLFSSLYRLIDAPGQQHTCYHKRCLAMGSALHAVTGDGPAQQILATAGPRLEIHAQQPAAGRPWERP